MMTSRSKRREWVLMGHVHAGSSRCGRREWWELIILRHVAKHAAAWHVAKEGLQFEPTMRALRIRMLALGEVLRDLRKASRKWALRQIIRVSEELGLYEEDVEDAV